MKRDGLLLLSLATGFALWTIAFGVLYSALSVGCELGWDEMPLTSRLSVQQVQLAGWTIFFVMGGLLIAKRLAPNTTRKPEVFLQTLAYRCAIAAFASSLIVFGAVFFLSPC